MNIKTNYLLLKEESNESLQIFFKTNLKNKNMLHLKLKLHYPSALEWMWSYCIYLGPFTASDGNSYDLGVHEDSAAIVFGNGPGDYYSGELKDFGYGNRAKDEAYEETRKRAKSLKLY